MFEVSPTEVVKMPEMHYLDLSHAVKSRRDRNTAGSQDRQHRENLSFTGWTNVNSPNASQIAQETHRHDKHEKRDRHCTSAQGCTNNIKPKSKTFTDTVKEPVKETETERTTIQNLKRKLWIDVTREKPYEESLRNYPKITVDNPQSTNNRVSRGNKLTTALSRQKSTEFNVIHLYQSPSKPRESPLPMNLQPQQQQQRNLKGGTSGVQSAQVIKSPDIANPNKTSKKPETNTIFDISETLKEANISKTPVRSLNREKRSLTALKQREAQPLSMPTTFIGSLKPTKKEDSRKTKNLRLSKALSLWSKVASPTVLNKFNTQPEEPREEKYLDVFSIDLKDLSGTSKVSGNLVPMKMLGFSKDAKDICSKEVKSLVPLPHFKPTIKAKKIDLEENDIESKILTGNYDVVKFRTTAPLNLYTKAWDTSNGFPRKTSKEFRRKSQIKRRPGDEVSTELYTSPDIAVSISPKINPRDLGNIIPRNIGDAMSRTYGTSFSGSDRTSLSDIQSKAAKRYGRVMKGSTASIDSSKKETNENKLEPNKEVKNFMLFEPST